MKLQITGEAKVDLATYKRFSEFQLFRSRNPRARKMAFYGSGIISSIFLLAIGLSGQLTFLFIGGAIILAMVMFAYMTKQIFKKECRLNAKMLRSTQNYVFAPDGFILEMMDEGTNSRSEIFYSDIYMIYEVKEAYYLYSDKKRAFIIPKSSIKKATVEQTREFLMAKVPKHKYVIVRQ